MGESVRRPHECQAPWWAHLALSAGLAIPAVAGAANPNVVYNVSISETVTDDAGAAQSGAFSGGTEDDGESDTITGLSLGLRTSHKGGRLETSLLLNGHGDIFARDQSRNTSYLTGDARATLEALEERIFVDAGGLIRRQNTSAFGRSSVDSAIDADNRAMVRQGFVAVRSPFHLGPSTIGHASLRQDWTTGSEALDGTRRRLAGALTLSNPLQYGAFGWDLAYTRSRTANDARTGTADLQTARAAGLYRHSEQVTLRLIAGHESNDYEAGVDRNAYIRGVGVDWALSPRTKFNGTVEKRFFGTGYDYRLVYSRPLSSLQLRYSRDVSSIEDSQLVSLEDLLFQSFFTSLAATIPDPVQREQAARALAASVPNANSTFASFVTNTFSVTRRLQLTGALVGARNSLTLALSSSDNERIGSADSLSPEDDFSRFTRILMRSAVLSYVHKLSGLSDLSAAISRIRTEGSGASAEDVTRRTFTIGYNTRISSRTNGAITVRRQLSSGTREFTENALVVSLSSRF